MLNEKMKKLATGLLLSATMLLAACGAETGQAPLVQAEPQRISEFGRYEGYSEERFDEWVTTSQYIETRDGTRLAVDISRPSVDGVAVDERFPVLWTYSRYHRRWRDTPNTDRSPILQRLARHGYVIVCVNVRGGGASFGRYQGLFSEAETRDAYDVIDWLSKQEFSDGNVGMYGLSYMGITQYMAASTQHPALKAITPENGYFDFYDAVRAGGILREDMLVTWAQATQYLDKERPPVPVDEDTDGSLAAAAVLEHADNFDPIEPITAAKFRDSTAPEFDWLSDTPSRVVDKINNSGTAIYHLGAWHDPYTIDTLLHYGNYQGPQKMAFGPWAHGTNNDAERQERIEVYGTEMLRWFDHWLKGVDNGVMDEPAIFVAEMHKMRESWSWKPMPGFPFLDNTTDLYFSAGSDAADAAADSGHSLVWEPVTEAGAVDYAVDPETTTGTETRWDSNMGGNANYPDMTGNGARSLTFTTPPLDNDVVVAGPGVVTLYLSSTTPDVDVYALLEEVDASGVSSYITEGDLRVSLRKESEPPWDNLGLPWHRAFAEDQQLLSPGEVVEARFIIQPVVYRFKQGNRIRITIMGADKDNMEAPPFPDAVIAVQTGGDSASRVSLPIAGD